LVRVASLSKTYVGRCCSPISRIAATLSVGHAAAIRWHQPPPMASSRRCFQHVCRNRRCRWYAPL